MVTDFLFDGFRFVLKGPADPGSRTSDRSPSGETRSHECFRDFRRTSSQPDTTCPTGSKCLTVLSFLVILPVGEHFHIVTALPTLFFGAAAPPTACPEWTSKRSWAATTRRR
jgi:hypothetical protein